MEYRRRSLWNRVWENESLDALGREEHVRRLYEEEYRPWKEICYGIVLSIWKGARWLMGGTAVAAAAAVAAVRTTGNDADEGV